MDQLIRSDDPIEDAAVAEGFGSAPRLVPPRPDAALTALVTGMALAICITVTCIAVTAAAMSFGRAQSGHAAGSAAERSMAVATSPFKARG